MDPLQLSIDRLQAGDLSARDALIKHSCRRLRRLAHNMRKDFAHANHWEDTDDVLQSALLRLWRALKEVTPRSVSEFFCLAALQIRRQLIDVARQYFGPARPGGKPSGPEERHGPDSPAPPPYEKGDSSDEPSRLAIWSEFHRRVDTLPAEERETFDLLWYQELTQGEAAKLLGISLATLKRRWLSARRRLSRTLKDGLPEP